ncbi:MAG: hypothetical protein J1F05_04295 [Muribaculaceae bacterium]|nr:hypothetical protein [Muribaculaceae bacterium]
MKKFLLACSVLLLVLTGCTGRNNASDKGVVAPISKDGRVIELEDATLLPVDVAVEQLTVVDFNAVWCGPCRRLAPCIEELAQRYAGKVTFISVDVDRFGDLFASYELGSFIPAVVILKPGGGREVYLGINDLLPEEKFEAIINKNLH